MSVVRPSVVDMSQAAGTVVQGSFDELGTPLRDVTFVVVDLETTGGSPAGCGITEIGAVRVRGGVTEGEFQTLVDPGEPIPPFIAVLTGITDAAVAGAPRIAAALPSFLEFARGAVLVAHNAPFDIGFLKAAAASTGQPWPPFAVVDTVHLARTVLARGETRDCKLATLAAHFHATTTPTHRALDDARATVDVLHGLLERVGSLGVQSLEELRELRRGVSDEQRRKRHLADRLPDAAGVYLFKDDAGDVLYVGKSRSLRRRVRTYFTASETRSRMGEMVRLAGSVTPVVCATDLEAEVRELRLIAAHKPRYNRRSRNPGRVCWIKLTVEPFPRLSIVRDVRDDDTLYFGPFGSQSRAEIVRDVLHEAFAVRRCGERLNPRRPVSACVLADLGRCGAPCDGREDVATYAAHVAALRAAIVSDPGAVLAAARRRLARLADEERFEEAAEGRDRISTFLRAADRWQRTHALVSVPELLAARPHPDGGWELVVIRHGRLAGAAHAERGRPPRAVADALLAAAETVEPGPGPLPASTHEEVRCLLRWLDSPGTRLVELTGSWAWPARAAAAHGAWLAGPDVR